MYFHTHKKDIEGLAKFSSNLNSPDFSNYASKNNSLNDGK